MKRARVRSSSSSETKEKEQTQNIDETRSNFRHHGPPKFGGKRYYVLRELAAASVLIPSNKMRGHFASLFEKILLIEGEKERFGCRSLLNGKRIF
ncbi:hypothetical protein CEXT_698201 [Caerostris extrusa]|uniref:Uncharacterized protein n=1 Tax=Caerostris extrusa TaxID=172846 RepID=A0AAV4RZA1_CAEEX|nr:hypothetical protein CEXT_698201 [Caerostris extrusa]